MVSSRNWESSDADGGTGVTFREVTRSVHEERLEETKVFGEVLPPNLSAMGY